MDRKLFIAAHTRKWCVCVCVPYIHNSESARKNLRNRLKKEMGNGRPGNLTIDKLDS